MVSLALAGQAATHVPHAAHLPGSVTGPLSPGETACCGHICAHRPHRMHRLRRRLSSGWGRQLSGLWHQRHRSGQPFRNTVVRIPGPSWMAYRLMSKTYPETTGDAFPAGTGMPANGWSLPFITLPMIPEWAVQNKPPDRSCATKFRGRAVTLCHAEQSKASDHRPRSPQRIGRNLPCDAQILRCTQDDRVCTGPCLLCA
jgi:hypothetical protein